MFKKITIISILVIFLSTSAFAGRGDRSTGVPHGKWWNNSEVASQLNLSDKEIKILNDSYVNHRRKVIKLRALVEEEQFELNNLIDSRSFNDQEVLNQAKRLEEVRSNLSTERFHFFLDVRKLLGFDRYQQLKTMYQSIRQKRNSERFKKKMNKRNNPNEDERPYSSLNNHSHFKSKYSYRDDNDMSNRELTGPSVPDSSSYNDNRDVFEENL